MLSTMNRAYGPWTHTALPTVYQPHGPKPNSIPLAPCGCLPTRHVSGPGRTNLAQLGPLCDPLSPVRARSTLTID